MIPREAGRGRSFKGAGLYYLHDRGASTSERVAFTHTENVPTGDPHKALKWMARTAINADELKRESGAAATGRACARPVFCFSLAWHPEQEPKKWEMIGAGRQALRALGSIGGEAEIPLLVEAMRDPSPWAALNATEGLLAAGGARVLTQIATSGDGVGMLARQVLAEGAR